MNKVISLAAHLRCRLWRVRSFPSYAHRGAPIVMNEKHSRRVAVAVAAAMSVGLVAIFTVTSDGDAWNRQDPQIVIQTKRYSDRPVSSDEQAKRAAVTNDIDPCKLISQRVVDHVFKEHLPPVNSTTYTNSVGQRYCGYAGGYLYVSTRVERSNGGMLYRNFLERVRSDGDLPLGCNNLIGIPRCSYVYSNIQSDPDQGFVYPSTVVINASGVTVSIVLQSYSGSREMLDELAGYALKRIKQFTDSKRV